MTIAHYDAVAISCRRALVYAINTKHIQMRIHLNVLYFIYLRQVGAHIACLTNSLLHDAISMHAAVSRDLMMTFQLRDPEPTHITRSVDVFCMRAVLSAIIIVERNTTWKFYFSLLLYSRRQWHETPLVGYTSPCEKLYSSRDYVMYSVVRRGVEVFCELKLILIMNKLNVIYSKIMSESESSFGFIEVRECKE